jgi:hypothetical protein
MSVSSHYFEKVFVALWNKEIDWDSDTIYAALTHGYTPGRTTHDYWNDVTGELTTGSGYTANGQLLASKTITYTAGSNLLTLDAADSVWTTSTLTADAVVIYDRSPASDATRPLLCYQLSTSDISSSGGSWTAQYNAAGIMTHTFS